MTIPSLPRVVNDYFALIDGSDSAATLSLFSAEALVRDDGADHRGRDEVLAWLDGPASQFETTTTPISARVSDDTSVVLAHLTGSFPGGEVDLQHTFSLGADGLIETLTISVSETV